MLIILPLISALSATPAIANSYSASEKRTLQSAINSALHSAEIQQYYQQCKEPAVTESGITAVITDKQQPRLQALLQEKVHTQNIEQLLQADAKLTEIVKRSIVSPDTCEDSKAYQALLDNYELALFSLEIAIPLDRPIGNKVFAAKSRSNAEQHEVQQLISRSHAIALANVVDKQQLNAVQQANYLHPDYQGRYVFKIQHGWRGNMAHYIGMHIFVSDADIDKTPKQWLVFLDKNGHFITAIDAGKARLHLKTLQNAEWRYDVHGNLQRN